MNSTFKFQNSKFKFKILSAPELENLNFKILSALELKFKIQNPLSSGAGILNFKILSAPELENSKFKISLLRSWNFKIQIQNLTPPELEF